MGKKASVQETVSTIRRKLRRQFHGEEKIRILLEGLRGEDSVAECDVAKASLKACPTSRRRSFLRQASQG